MRRGAVCALLLVPSMYRGCRQVSWPNHPKSLAFLLGRSADCRPASSRSCGGADGMPCPLAGVGVQAQLPGGPVAVVCLQRQHLGKKRRAGVREQGLRVGVVSGGFVRQHDQVGLHAKQDSWAVPVTAACRANADKCEQQAGHESSRAHLALGALIVDQPHACICAVWQPPHHFNKRIQVRGGLPIHLWRAHKVHGMVRCVAGRAARLAMQLEAKPKRHPTKRAADPP